MSVLVLQVELKSNKKNSMYLVSIEMSTEFFKCLDLQLNFKFLQSIGWYN